MRFDILPDIAEGHKEEVQIIKEKSFDVDTMMPEDAVVQMELLQHDFYVFKDAGTKELAVVYIRGDKTYGIIRPKA